MPRYIYEDVNLPVAHITEKKTTEVSPLWVMPDGRKYRIKDLSDRQLYEAYNKVMKGPAGNAYQMYWRPYLEYEIARRSEYYELLSDLRRKNGRKGEFR